MPAFVPGLSAVAVVERLRSSLEELDTARENVALWFAEVLHRRLWRDLGYSSVYQFAAEDLGFSRSRTAAYLRIARSMAELPELRAAVQDGDLPWSKANVVARVATPDTAGQWVEEARTTGRRELESRARAARETARTRAAGTGQGAIPLDGASPRERPVEATASGGDSGPQPAEGKHPEGSAATAGSSLAATTSEAISATANCREADSPSAHSAAAITPAASSPATPDHPPRPSSPPPATVPVTLRFSAEQYAEFETLRESLAKSGVRGSAEQIAVLALRALASSAGAARTVASAAAAGSSSAASTSMAASGFAPGAEAVGARFAPSAPLAAATSPSQIVVTECPSCRTARVPTSRGDLELDPVTLDRLRCQARVARPGARNRAAIPETRRREVLTRDGFRCRGAGCGNRSFLEVHHVRPRHAGGSNRAENLITLCSGCHQALHRVPVQPAAEPEGVVRDGMAGQTKRWMTG